MRIPLSVYVRHVAGSDIQKEDPIMGVGEHDARPVRRPFRQKVKGRVLHVDSTLVFSELICDHQAEYVASAGILGDQVFYGCNSWIHLVTLGGNAMNAITVYTPGIIRSVFIPVLFYAQDHRIRHRRVFQ